MSRLRQQPDVNKTTLYAIVVNLIQIAVLIVFALYVTLADLSVQSRLSLQIIAVLGSLMASWGALIDIQEALRTRRRERTINDLQTTNGQMDALNLKLRAQRHDFLNHLQVVYSLLEMEEYGDATRYLEQVYSQLHAVSTVLRTRMTAFNALLQVKSAAARERGVALTLDIKSTLEGLKTPPWELCRVMGNLLDNAMDAAAQAPEPKIAVRVTEDLRRFAFEVRNNGAPVPTDLREHIFEAGFSTKGEGRGMGLFIARQTLEEYGGSIALDTDGGETAFRVVVPKDAQRTQESIPDA